MKKKKKPLAPVLPEMCGTCPFRQGSPTALLALHLAESALTSTSRICHSTGKNNAFHKDTGKPERLCRGARDIQINYFYKLGFIEAPTDEAWDKKWAEVSSKPPCPNHAPLPGRGSHRPSG